MSQPKLQERNSIGEMLSLNYHGCLQTILLLLTKMGYEEVSLADRTDFVGRNNDGGIDITGFRPVPGGRRRVIVQVKQYMPEKLIYRNHLDDTRGVVLREGAAEGVLDYHERSSLAAPCCKNGLHLGCHCSAPTDRWHRPSRFDDPSPSRHFSRSTDRIYDREQIPSRSRVFQGDPEPVSRYC